jgi:hypothetical protein
MRLICGLLLLITSLGWLASALPQGDAPPPSKTSTDWRRTAHGWLRMHMPPADARPPMPAVHPAALACLEVSILFAVAVASSLLKWWTRYIRAHEVGLPDIADELVLGPYRVAASQEQKQLSQQEVGAE